MLQQAIMKLGLEEICPIWYNKLRNNDLTNIEDKKMCIVGEAYGFTGVYGSKYQECKECLKHAWTFVNYQKDIWENIPKFLKHWNQEHC